MKYYDTFEENTFYHIFNHSVGNENLFRNDENFRYFLKKYTQYTETVFDTYAYCLMPNHFHFLVKIKPYEQLKQLPKFSDNVHKFVMQKLSNLLNAYAKAYNTKYKRKGALFLDFTKRITINDETYFTTIVNYIHQNPVHHGFCKTIEEWYFSSYNAILSEKTTKIQREYVLDWFGGIKNFVQFHNDNTAVLQDELEFLNNL